MIIVTERSYLDGTGDVPKDIEYATANDYTVMTGDNVGDLLVYKRTDVTPEPSEQSKFVVLAYYRAGYYSKIILK